MSEREKSFWQGIIFGWLLGVVGTVMGILL